MKFKRWFKWKRETPHKEVLSDLLFTKQGREELLGVSVLGIPSPSNVLRDVNRILTYSSSSDYQTWSQEAWARVLIDLDELLKPDASEEKINFYRGALSRTLALLRLSHEARLREPAIRQQVESLARGKTSAAATRH